MNIKLFSFLIFLFLLFSFVKTEASDNRWSPGIIASPRGGYIDSIFVTPDEKRLYFFHSIMAPLDFALGTSTYPRATYLPNHVTAPGYEWNSDIYYIEWNGSTWSAPVNLGPNINTRANECCMWLNDSETEIIFLRDENIPAPRGNLISTRASKNDPWGPATFLPGVYGSENQSSSLYRHDIQKMVSGTGDLYLWEKNNNNLGNPGRLLYGKKSASGWLAPQVIAGTDSPDEETQPWVSTDEKTILYTKRNASAVTTLWRVVRKSVTDPWEAPTEVPITGFNDPYGLAVWGEVSVPAIANKMVAIRLNTAVPGWQSEIIKAEGAPFSEFSNLVVLNSGSFTPSSLPAEVLSFLSIPTPSLDTNASGVGRVFTVSLYNPGQLTVLSGTEFTGLTNAGLVTFSPNTSNGSLSSGIYDVRVKTSGSLARKKSNLSLLNNANLGTFPNLISGDLNNDNVINSMDWSVMTSEWFQLNKASDLNGDGYVNSLDFTWLNRNWFMTGE